MVLQERLHALGALCLQLQAASCSAAHPPSLLAAASRDSRHGRHCSARRARQRQGRPQRACAREAATGTAAAGREAAVAAAV